MAFVGREYAEVTGTIGVVFSHDELASQSLLFEGLNSFV